MTQHTRRRDPSNDREGPLRAAASVLVGAAVEPELIARDERYGHTIKREFNGITPDNAMKWEVAHRGECEWSFGPAESVERRRHKAPSQSFPQGGHAIEALKEVTHVERDLNRRSPEEFADAHR
jgi:Glycosyl hydrolase family 10